MRVRITYERGTGGPLEIVEGEHLIDTDDGIQIRNGNQIIEIGKLFVVRMDREAEDPQPNPFGAVLEELEPWMKPIAQQALDGWKKRRR